jgi:hypothetical protein
MCHPLGMDPTSPEIADKMMKGLDPLGKALSVGLPIAEHFVPELEHSAPALGPLGVGISVAGAANEGRKLVQTIAEDGPNAIHDQRFYNAEAGVASNSVHALLGGGSLIPTPAAPFLKGADAAISAVELGTDIAGATTGLIFGGNAKFDSNSVEGALLRGMMGDKSVGYDAGEWTRNKLGPGVGSALAATAVNMGTNAVASPINMANTLYHGIGDYFQGVQQGAANGDGGLLGWGLQHGLNGVGLPADNPLLMNLAPNGLGKNVGTHPARVAAGLSEGGARAGGGLGRGSARAGAGLGMGTARAGAGLRAR